MKILGMGVATLLLAAAVHAGEPAAAPETVTIEAQKQRQLIEHQISTYVSAITLPNSGEALLRWHQPVCPAVVGLSNAEDEFVLARLSQAAVNVGAPLAPENCIPNFLVVATREPGVLIQKWWERNPGLFNTDKGVGGIKHFVASKTPIRAWYNAELGCTGGAFRVRGGGTYTPSHCDATVSGSKLKWNVVRAIYSVIVLVDLSQVADLTVGQLTDYVTLLGLAQIRDGADPGPAPTILHLFTADATARPEGLSSWDQDFLKALYDTESDAVVEVSQIKVRLDHELAR